ncbi:MAG: ParB/RepB/Spo0J family partition protein [Candidatus Hydrogenedentes bacterium]|nr:ParB/RepB/Spo0J family partition protein [Candidatus Hydrogenedentota bacterium]
MSKTTKKKSTKGLGKGLNALMRSREEVLDHVLPTDADTQANAQALPAAAGAKQHVGERVLLIDPSLIQPNPKQPRRLFHEERLAELADSIGKDGIQEPLIVRQVKNEYQIVCGERRCRAAIMAGLDRVPVICRDIADNDMLKFGLIENIQREDLNPIELAQAYRDLMEQYDWTQEQVAEEVGKKRATVANTLRLLQLPDPIQDLVVDGSITMGHARAVVTIPNETRQLALVRHIVENGLSVRQSEALAAKEVEPSPKAAARRTAKEPHIIELENRLRRRLGVKVAFKHQKDNKGKIEIEYFSLEELDRILDIIVNQ